MCSQAIGETVPAEIEPGTGADLVEGEGEAAAGGDLEESTEEDRRAADLVGLGRMVEKAAQEILMPGESLAKRRPERATPRAAGGGKLCRQGRRLSSKGHIVKSAKKPERQHAALEIAFPAGEEGAELAAGVDIRRDRFHGLGPERRAQLGAKARLPAQRGRQGFGRMGHEGGDAPICGGIAA